MWCGGNEGFCRDFAMDVFWVLGYIVELSLGGDGGRRLNIAGMYNTR